MNSNKNVVYWNTKIIRMHINDLPAEILIQIFSYLSLPQYLNTKQVCLLWKSITESIYSWKFHPVVYDGDLTSFGYIHNIALLNGEYISHLIFKRCKYTNIRNILESVNLQLTSLEFIMCLLDSEILDIVSKFHNLKKLSFQNSYTMCQENVMKFDNMPKLERLFLSNFALCKDNFDGLFQCSHISFLMIEKIRNLPEDLIISFLQQNKNILQGIALYGDCLSDDAMRVIASCQHLTHLRIIRCDKFTDKSLDYLKKLHLKKLLLWNNDKFSTKALVSFFSDKNTKPLTYISFSRVNNLILDVVKAIVKNCEHLDFIAFYRCSQLIDKGNYIKDILRGGTKLFFE